MPPARDGRHVVADVAVALNVALLLEVAFLQLLGQVHGGGRPARGWRRGRSRRAAVLRLQLVVQQQGMMTARGGARPVQLGRVGPLLEAGETNNNN